MVYLDVFTSAPLLPLIAAYQAGVNQDVRILTRLGHTPPDGDLESLHTVMAPWLARVGFRFVRQLCPMLLLSYALEYGRVDVVHELIATKLLYVTSTRWALLYGTWRCCIGKHMHLQRHYTADRDGHVYDGDGSYRYAICGNGACIAGSLHHFAVAAILGDHVDLLQFVTAESSLGAYSRALVALALRGGRLYIVLDLYERGVISAFKAHHMRLAVMSGSVDLVAFLLANSSSRMIADAFAQAVTQNQFALLQWLCAKYDNKTYWAIALDIAVTHVQQHVIAYFAATHDLHLAPAKAARMDRRRKRHNNEKPARQTRLRK
ncbi:hypothetical protein SDRG_03990 [Saprolegnia diclina VS20]|uniref:Uncharacterized protein n=1 Tax=Saprolegnia diclina (strain VS20) TaxID=1156394 RepID=T0S2A1_SAPDV|nr:hypothetical protein SDRG_03990 [Saprolegnia diclina VS20]EQC39038.1 hypothetical protein SDRG_03990 [Saprolegnia diclina VS20]|eukprot:XP_008607862.1 hypothetical protein SDRG_03990 [Saprolegnia diclina VS20]